MGQALLVNLDVENGKKVLQTLDASRIKIKVALWAHLPEYSDWRLLLASPQFDVEDRRDAYGLVFSTLYEAGLTPQEAEPIMIFGMKDRFIRDLRSIFSKAKSVEGMRLGGQSFGNRYVEDAYVYRIT
jgi:hypothetical protein